MKTVKSVLTIALAFMVMGAVSATAGTDGANSKTAKGKRSASLKKGEHTQGTFAYRFITYSNYADGQQECSISDPNCTANMNDDLRAQSSPYGTESPTPELKDSPAVKKSVDTKAATPSDD